MYILGFWEKQFSNWKNKTEKKTLNEKYSDSEIKIEVDWLLSLLINTVTIFWSSFSTENEETYGYNASQ